MTNYPNDLSVCFPNIYHSLKIFSCKTILYAIRVIISQLYIYFTIIYEIKTCKILYTLFIDQIKVNDSNEFLSLSTCFIFQMHLHVFFQYVPPPPPIVKPGCRTLTRRNFIEYKKIQR